jgi:hypothetical protein
MKTANDGYSGLSIYEPNFFATRIVSTNTITSAFVGAKDRHSRVTPGEVARKFRCGLETV